VRTPSDAQVENSESNRHSNGRSSTLSAERVRALHLPKEAAAETPHVRFGRWILILGFVAAIALLYFLASHVIPQVFGKTREVNTVLVSTERLVDVSLGSPGYIISRSQVSISPKIPGTIQELYFAEGQRVKKGDRLAKLEDWQFKAEVDQAKAAVKIAEAKLEALRNGARPEEIRKAQAAVEQADAHRDLLGAEFKRMEKIKDTISPSEFDRTHTAFLEAKAAADQLRATLELVQVGSRPEEIKAAEGEVDRAKALLSKAEYFLDATEIRAPINGIVLEKNVEVGEMVRAETASLNARLSICVLANMDQLEAEIDVQERDLADVHLGQVCLITLEAYPGVEFRGTLDHLAPMYNRQRGIRQAKIRIQNPDERLSPDMSCRVQVLKEKLAENKAKTPCLPQEAVVKADGKTWVYLVEDGVVKHREVSLGKSVGGKVEIARGLREGEVVALAGSEPLSDGQHVLLAEKRTKVKAGGLLGP
jgi:RND family efflux transporter MFP subunit